MSTTPEFTILADHEPGFVPARRPRRDWRPVKAALEAGQSVFSESFTESDLKYLTLHFNYRLNGGPRLRSRREERKGVIGRLLWLE